MLFPSGLSIKTVALTDMWQGPQVTKLMFLMTLMNVLKVPLVN